MYIDIRILNNDYTETGFGYRTRTISEFMANAIFDKLCTMLTKD